MQLRIPRPAPGVARVLLLGAAFAVAVAGAGGYAFWPSAAPVVAKAPPLPASALVGQASVIDGDTINIRGQRIRLHGVDAPESAQSCRDGQGRDYRCGQKATAALAEKIGRQTVSCEQRDIDRYKRVVAVCRAGNEDLNAWLVREGHAVAYRQFSTAYVRAEDEART
jgi:endonuclease YncB( thermonuclease family)